MPGLALFFIVTAALFGTLPAYACPFEDLHVLKRKDYLENEIIPLIATDIEAIKLSTFAKSIKENLPKEFIKSTFIELGIYQIQENVIGSGDELLLIDHLKFQLYLDQARMGGYLTSEDIQNNFAKITEIGRPNFPDTLELDSSERRFSSIFDDLIGKANDFAVKANVATEQFSLIPKLMDADKKIDLNVLEEFPYAKMEFDKMKGESKGIIELAGVSMVDAWNLENALLSTIEKQKPTLGWGFANVETKRKLLKILRLTERFASKVQQDFDRVIQVSLIGVPSPNVAYQPTALYENRISQFNAQTKSLSDIRTKIEGRMLALEQIFAGI